MATANHWMCSRFAPTRIRYLRNHLGGQSKTINQTWRETKGKITHKSFPICAKGVTSIPPIQVDRGQKIRSHRPGSISVERGKERRLGCNQCPQGEQREREATYGSGRSIYHEGLMKFVRRPGRFGGASAESQGPTRVSRRLLILGG